MGRVGGRAFADRKEWERRKEEENRTPSSVSYQLDMGIRLTSCFANHGLLKCMDAAGEGHSGRQQILDQLGRYHQ